MTTLAKISAAEARRRFTAAKRYRLLRREFNYPNMSKPLTEAQRDWRAGLDEDKAEEIVRLIAWKEEGL